LTVLHISGTCSHSTIGQLFISSVTSYQLRRLNSDKSDAIMVTTDKKMKKVVISDRKMTPTVQRM